MLSRSKTIYHLGGKVRIFMDNFFSRKPLIKIIFEALRSICIIWGGATL